MAKLANARVAIFGIGGVGGYVAEALSRSGVSSFALIDKDVVSESNINRQIIATYNTIGQSKCEVMKDRILSINPNAKVDDVVAATNINKNKENKYFKKNGLIK